MSTVFWPPPPWVGRSRSRPRRRSRKRRPRRPRPSPSSSPSSSRLSRVSRWPRSSARLSRPPRSSVRSVRTARGPRSSVGRSGRTGPCAGRGRRSGPCAGRGRRDCARYPGCRSPGRRCPGRRRAGRPRRRPPRWSRERHRWSEWPRMHRSRPGRGGRPARRAHGAGASVGGWAHRRARRRRGCRPAVRERRPRGSARRPAWCRRAAQARRPAQPRRRGADAAGSAAGRRIGFRALARRAGGPRGDATAPGRRRRLRSGLGHAAVAVRAGHRGLGQRELRNGSARLALLDRGDEVALAHLRGVRDVQFTRELAELGEHHRAQALAAGGGGSAARGVRRARLGRGTGGDEIGLAHEGPS